MIDADNHNATISDHGMIVACMAVLRSKGVTKEQAVPTYQQLLDHPELKAEAINADLTGALRQSPTKDLARAHQLEIHPELEGAI